VGIISKRLTTANPQKTPKKRKYNQTKMLSMFVTSYSINEGHTIFSIAQIKGTAT
jgi:hypothetical protein